MKGSARASVPKAIMRFKMHEPTLASQPTNMRPSIAITKKFRRAVRRPKTFDARSASVVCTTRAVRPSRRSGTVSIGMMRKREWASLRADGERVSAEARL